MGLILIMLGVPVLMGLIWKVFGNEDDDAKSATGVTLVFTFFIVACIMMPVFWVSSIGTVNRMEAMYSENLHNYDRTIEMLERGIEATKDKPLDLANLSQIESYQKAITDKRNAINKFNEIYRNHTYWQDSFINGLFIKNLPDYMEPIRID